MMFPPRPTELAHQLLRSAIRDGDLAIDATAGNGHDTRFLAECVGASGKVIAIDIQEAAIESSRHKIAEAGFSERVEFHQCCHSELPQYAADGTVAAVMFNLGYLPGRDHGLTTERSTTLMALESAANLLRPGGILSVVCYPGHDTGAVEATAVESWMAGLAANSWRVSKYGMLGTLEPSPFLLIATQSKRPRPTSASFSFDSLLPPGDNPVG